MFDSALDGSFRALFVQGEDIAQSDPNTGHVHAALAALDLVVVQDLFVNETAKFAHVLLPGTSFLEKDGTFTNAERRINRVRPRDAGAHRQAGVADRLRDRTGDGLPDALRQLRADHGRDRADDATFAGVSFAHLDAVGSVQWPCTEQLPGGTPIMHVDGFVRGKGRFMVTPYVPTRERSTRRFPLILTTGGRILSQYNVGAQTRRTANVTWHPEDVLELHPHDAEVRGVTDGDRVELSSRVGTTSLRARISDRMPVGVCYTTFHHPVSGANVVTTDNSDWATNCPEYKVTAVQVTPSTAPRAAASAHERTTVGAAGA